MIDAFFAVIFLLCILKSAFGSPKSEFFSLLFLAFGVVFSVALHDEYYSFVNAYVGRRHSAKC